MRVAIVGSRNYPALEHVQRFVETLPQETVVISGGAAGVDQAAENAARGRGMAVEVNRPEYGKYMAKQAPLIRNTEIARQCDEMVVFWDGSSRGSLDAVRKARRAGKRVRVYVPAGVSGGDLKRVAISSLTQLMNYTNSQPGSA